MDDLDRVTKALEPLTDQQRWNVHRIILGGRIHYHSSQMGPLPKLVDALLYEATVDDILWAVTQVTPKV